jgi:hypothetical protein
MKPKAEIGGLFLSLLLIAGPAGLTTGAVANATPQTASPIVTTPVPSAKLPTQEWNPQITVRVHNYAHVDTELLVGARSSRHEHIERSQSRGEVGVLSTHAGRRGTVSQVSRRLGHECFCTEYSDAGDGRENPNTC